MTQFVPGRKGKSTPTGTTSSSGRCRAGSDSLTTLCLFHPDEEVKPAPDGIPRVHVRVKITEEGDYFEDFIPWDIRDPYLKDPET